MVEFKNLTEDLQSQFKDYVSSDDYGLSPETLYRNTFASLINTPREQVAMLMEISISTVDQVLTENNED